MAQYGCKITILDLDYGLGEKTLNEFINKGVDRQNLQVYQCDVSDFENVQDVFQNCVSYYFLFFIIIFIFN